MFGVLPFVQDPDLSGTAGPVVPQHLPPCDRPLHTAQTQKSLFLGGQILYFNGIIVHFSVNRLYILVENVHMCVQKK